MIEVSSKPCKLAKLIWRRILSANQRPRPDRSGLLRGKCELLFECCFPDQLSSDHLTADLGVSKPVNHPAKAACPRPPCLLYINKPGLSPFPLLSRSATSFANRLNCCTQHAPHTSIQNNFYSITFHPHNTATMTGRKY